MFDTNLTERCYGKTGLIAGTGKGVVQMNGRALVCVALACCAGVCATSQRANGHSGLLRIGATQEERELVGGEGHADLTEAEDAFGLPKIPIWPESGLDGSALVASGGRATLATFHPPFCDCGRSYGIAYDLYAIAMDRRYCVNEVLLHEVTHAWQFWSDPVGWAANVASEIKQHGYADAPHEVEARMLARQFHEAGVRVWFT